MNWVEMSLLFASAGAALAWAFSGVCRFRNAVLENAIWRLAVVVFLLTPLLVAVGARFPRHQMRIPLPAKWHAPSLPAWMQGPIGSVSLPAMESGQQQGSQIASSGKTLPKDGAVWNGSFIAAAIWLSGAGFLLLRLLIAISRNRSLLRRTSEADESWAQELRALSRDLEMVPPALRICQEVNSPHLIGLWRPCILLPATLDRPSREVLLHELSHVRRRDLWWLLLARVAAAVWFFHPLAWITLRRLERSSENVSDDFVLSQTGNAPDYATQLVGYLGGGAAERPVFGIGMAAFRSALGKRIQRILTPTRDLHRGLGRRDLSALGCVAILIFCGSFAVRFDRLQAADTSKPEASDSDWRLLKEVTVSQEGDPVMDANEVVKLSELQSGKRISSQSRNASLKKLFGTGHFQNLRFYVEDKDDSTSVAIFYKGRSRLRKVDFQSPPASPPVQSLLAGTWAQKAMASPKEAAARTVDEYTVWKDARQIEKNAAAAGISGSGVTFEIKPTDSRGRLADVIFKLQPPKNE
jgi:beta-lactamase regulating signal transducer with metallopeptidase domain